MKLEVQASLSPAVRQLAETLAGPRRTELARAMGAEVQKLTAEHLGELSATRHATANRLGAEPTGHLHRAAQKAAQPGALTASADHATLTIVHPGLIRALRDVFIAPRTAKSLAIPLHALAYGRRPSTFGTELFVMSRSKEIAGRAVLALKQPGGAPPLLLYVLVRSVTQKQDRTLLPATNELASAAARGATQFLQS